MFRHRTMRFGSVQPTKLVTPYDGQAINRADVREKIARNANNSPDETANCGLACKTSNYNVHRLSTFIDKQDDRMGNTHDCSLDTKACATDQRQSLSWRASSTWKRSSSLKRGFETSAIFKLVVLVMLCLASAWTSAEPQFNRRFDPPVQRTRHGIISLFNDNASNPTDSAKEYLDIFGWVDPPDWASVSPRANETVEEGGQWGRQEASIDVNQTKGMSRIDFVTKQKFQELSDQKFKEALKSFQQASGLVVTGILDESTMFVMSQPRCGVPDQTAVKNKNVSALTDLTAQHERDMDPTNEGNFTVDEGFGSGDNDTKAPSAHNVSDAAKLRNRRSIDLTETNGGLFGGDYYNNYGIPPLSQIQEASEVTNGDTVLANFVTEDVVSEAELAHSSRVESMKTILEALRREKVYQKEPNSEAGTIPPTPTLTSRIVSYARDSERRRQKRSTLFKLFTVNGWGLAFGRDKITWRLVKEWPSVNPFMSNNEVWFTVKLAFRMWSEVLPRTFVEDNTSPVNQVDILVGFGNRKHNRCPVQFRNGPFTQEYAHAWPLPKSEIHFNDAQPFVSVSWLPGANTRANNVQRSSHYPISLLKVALHEIGHTLGLPHSENRQSIMNPFYQPYQSKDVELGSADRQSIQQIYGSCVISFDAVFDWVRQVRTGDGKMRWKFNTYFFRNSWYWLYDNRAHRPRYGDPKLITEYWRGVLDPTKKQRKKIDGVVHVRDWNRPNGPTYFFSGDVYTEYDNINDRAKVFDRFGRPYPRKISVDFPGIPSPIDTVLYKWDEGLLYFFKANKVHRFNWTKRKVEDVNFISTTFPGWGGASHLPDNIDSAYYSYTDEAYYFFKGHYYWKLAGAKEKDLNVGMFFPYNAVGPRQVTGRRWKDLCDVGPTELIMNLRKS